MKTTKFPNWAALQLLMFFCLLLTFSAAGAVRYVNVNSGSPSSPYTSWATAARAIQDAANVAVNGDLILVTNGIYQTGRKTVSGQANRVAVTNAVTVQSVNGASVTTINASLGPSDVIRGVYLATNAALIGFTVAYGYTIEQDGACVFGGSVSNCYITLGYSENGNGGGIASCRVEQSYIVDNFTYGDGGGAHNCILNYCALTGNGTQDGGGGGASFCTLNHSIINYNGGYFGGGAFESVLNECLVTSNDFAGTWECTITNCMVTNNFNGGVNGGTSSYCQIEGNINGGAGYGALYNCSVTGNFGKGALLCMLVNCSVTGNSDAGVDSSTLTNCTVTGNLGVGLSSSAAFNSVIYYNDGGNYDSDTTNNFSYCCTTPKPSTGIGNITNEPAFVDFAAGNFHLQPNSHCINSGNNAYALGLDLDGNLRIAGSTVDMGAYEFPAFFLVNCGIVASKFGFNITGLSDQVVIVEASTNLLNWLPLQTNTLGISPLSFSDSASASFAKRFYRVRLQ